MSNIRFMNPCTIQCDSCGEIIPPRRKFNGNKKLLKERYLDKVKVYTLSFHCPQCHNLLVLQTDPQRADYITKSGCHRLFHNNGSTDSIDTTKENDVGSDDKAKKIEDRLKSLQRQQSQMDELSKIQELQSKIHQQEMLNVISTTPVERFNSESDDGVNNTGSTTKLDPENSSFPRPEKQVSEQFEEETTTINTTDLIKLRTTSINNKKNRHNNNNSNKIPNKTNPSLSLGVIVKSKKKKGRIIKKDKV